MFVVWFGSTARLTVSDPALIREIFVLKSELFEKNEPPPLVRKIEGDGLLSLKDQKWAHHRKIIQPTFHTENLKVCMYVCHIEIQVISSHLKVRLFDRIADPRFFSSSGMLLLNDVTC